MAKLGGDLAEFGKKNATQKMIFLPIHKHNQWGGDNKDDCCGHKHSFRASSSCFSTRILPFVQEKSCEAEIPDKSITETF